MLYEENRIHFIGPCLHHFLDSSFVFWLPRQQLTCAKRIDVDFANNFLFSSVHVFAYQKDMAEGGAICLGYSNRVLFSRRSALLSVLVLKTKISGYKKQGGTPNY